MKQVIGILIIILGLVLGLYFGVWWAFIGGIVQVITACKAPELVALTLATGIAKVIFATFIGCFVAFCCFIPGFALASSK